MKLLFVCDPLDTFKIYKDSTYAMMREAAARGHAVYSCAVGELRIRNGVVEALTRPLRFTENQSGHDWYAEGETAALALTEFGGVIMRKDPPFDAAYLYATQLFSLAEAAGARIHNRGQALRDFNEKLAIFQFTEFIAPTIVTYSCTEVREFLAEHGDIIVKPLDGMGGTGIFRLTLSDKNIGSILETLSQNGTQYIMAQRYLPAIVEGDKRILLINGQPVDWCLARIPQQGETRGNLAAGGRGVAQPLSARDRQIAEQLGPQLAAQGLLLVGLDVIGDNLTEVNVTSPTCFQEITAQSGINVAGLFIDAVERKAR